jgi:putative methyltransferase (TIGR04325 family)
MKERIKNVVKRVIGRPGWYGDYPSWEDALEKSSGYDSKHIVEKVKDSLLKVKNGEAAFERDSVSFDKFEYVWPVVAGLFWIAAQRGGKLNVLDFGGSLGSTFFQYRKFLQHIDVRWNIVEQDLFVDYGKKYFQNEHLHFYHSLKECLSENEVNVVLLSSVLPYVEKPYDILKQVISAQPPFIILDKMPFRTEGDRDLLTVQYVPEHIYSASYPAWFFNKRNFFSIIEMNYEVVEEFVDEDRANVPSVYQGIILRKK